MQDATFLFMLNAIGATCSAILALSVYQIPIPQLPQQKIALHYFRLAIIMWAIAFSAGSIQVLAMDHQELRFSSILLANLGYISSYFFILVAVTSRYKGMALRVKSWQYGCLLSLTTLVVVTLLDNFELRNFLMPQIEALLLIAAIISVHKTQRVMHRGDQYLKLCLYLLLSNLLITNMAIVQITPPGISTSLRVLLFILLNGILLTSAMYGLFLNDIIEQTKHEGSIDELSGTYNRKVLNQLAELENPIPNGCVVLCDLDLFKRINDSHGHDAGDKVIVQFTRLLKSAIRPGDMVIRLGGEEFLLLLSNTGLHQAIDIAKRLCTQTAKEQLLHNGQHLSFTASFGVCEIERQSLLEAIARADKMLYVAKGRGRNQVVSELPKEDQQDLLVPDCNREISI